MADEREPSLSEIYAAVCEMSDRLENRINARTRRSEFLTRRRNAVGRESRRRAQGRRPPDHHRQQPPDLPAPGHERSADEHARDQGASGRRRGGRRDREGAPGLIRHIEYDSNADVAYDTAVNSAAAIGFGYFRLLTDYESPTSFDQKIMFQRIRNALSVRDRP
jgi:hypothetical protein